MHLFHRIILCAFMLLALLSASCSGSAVMPGSDEAPVNSIYYWKTVFRLDSAEYDILRRHDIGQIYLRMFDVCKDRDYNKKWSVVPNATMRFEECDSAGVPDPRLSELRFTPVVYITLDALKDMDGREGELAGLIVQRVASMCSYNELPNVRTLQLDCDWTASTERSYFDLCRAVREEIRERDLPWKLSSTIRLHQLGRDVPPVDKGVLMVYNTGQFNDPDETNSILEIDDVRPFVGKLGSYRLPLDVAYPVYGWQLIFRNRRFIGITSGLDLADNSKFEQESKNSYRVKYNASVAQDHRLQPYDIVRNELSSYSDVMRVKALIDSRLSGRRYSNILYHLDSELLSNFSDDEIDSLY